jgi:trigger factor
MELYQKNPEAMASIRAPIFEDKIVDFITEMATVKEKTVSPEQLMSPPEEALDQSSEKPKKKPAKRAASKKKAVEAKKDKK